MGHEKAPTTFYIFKRWWTFFQVQEILNLMTLAHDCPNFMGLLLGTFYSCIQSKGIYAVLLIQGDVYLIGKQFRQDIF